MNYLEKIFQIPYTIRPMQPSGFKALIDDLTAAPPETATPRAGGSVSPSPATSRDGSVDGVELATPEHEACDCRGSSRESPGGGGEPDDGGECDRTSGGNDRGACGGDDAAGTGARAGEKLPLAHRNPVFLRLETWEQSLMKELYRFVPSPRATKRFVNVYQPPRRSVPSRGAQPSSAMPERASIATRSCCWRC